MTRTACIDLARSDYEEAIAHTKKVLTHDAKNPLAPVVLALSYRALGETEKADDVIEAGRQDDCFHMLLRWLSGMSEAHFFSKMDSEPAQTTLDMAFDLLSMGQAAQTEKLLTAGYVVTALNDHCIVAIRELTDESICLGQLTDPPNFFLTGMFITPANIVIDAS